MTDPRTDRWQLPDGVDELLPGAAWRVERLRRDIVDGCRAWGFELVMPPLVEYLDSLLTGSGAGERMNRQTFKLVDQQNGRTLGVRADMTPQVARIDAHAHRSDVPNRLCYTGTVLKARADGAGGSRSPQHFGAELFGHAGVESDVEVIRLMLETVGRGGLAPGSLLLDLGHVGVYRALVADAALAPADEARVFEALQRGSVPDLRACLDEAGATGDAAGRLAALCALRGDASLIARAREVLDGAGLAVTEALDELERVVDAVADTHPDTPVLLDLSELRGFRYHTGLLFAVLDERGATLANGGRYDRVGEAFGRSRAATGFSGDLVQLADRSHDARHAGGGDTAAGSTTADRDRGAFVTSLAIHVPEPAGRGAWNEIRRLRSTGERVLCALPGSPDERARCDRELVRTSDAWTVRPLDPSSPST